MSSAETRAAGAALDDDRGYDVARVRRDFPILSERVHGKPLVYLDNAATTQKPKQVVDALVHHYGTQCSNVHRGVHLLSQKATHAFEGARRRMKEFLGARDMREIVFVRGATEAINLVAQSFGRGRFREGDEVVLTGMEHHSNIVPWQMLRDEIGIVLRVVPIDDAGEIDLADYEAALGPRTRLVAAVHVSNALGTVNPVREMIELAHARGVPVLLDGAQAVGHQIVNVQSLGCDFYTLSGHKMYGPTGIGVLYARTEHLESMPPYQGGGDMIASVTFERTTYNQLPHRFEAGTPDIAGAIGLAAAADYLDVIGRDAVQRYEAGLLEEAQRRVAAVPGVTLVGTAREKAAVVSFTFEGVHPHDVGTVLDLEGVAVRVGHHCAQPVMDRFGIPATVRASFGLYNTRQEIDALERGLHRVREVFGG
jgi:cysteine desulfurase/selenocysteine lyase